MSFTADQFRWYRAEVVAEVIDLAGCLDFA